MKFLEIEGEFEVTPISTVLAKRSFLIVSVVYDLSSSVSFNQGAIS